MEGEEKVCTYTLKFPTIYAGEQCSEHTYALTEYIETSQKKIIFAKGYYYVHARKFIHTLACTILILV